MNSITLDVLVLEDNPVKLSQVRELLIVTAAIPEDRIHAAKDAYTARRMLVGKSYDLLIVDLAVPESPGDAPDPGAGHRLLVDLFEGTALRMPAHIIGLTSYDDLAKSFADAFLSLGTLLVAYHEGSDAWQSPLLMRVRQALARKRAEAHKANYESMLSVVCTLEVELDAVLRLPWKWSEHEVVGDPTLYFKGCVNTGAGEQTVFAALSPFMGMSAASITATKAALAFLPRFIIMPGITAAIRGRANIGDIIGAEECWDWGMGKWAMRDGTATFIPGPHHISLDADLRSALFRLGRDEAKLVHIRTAWPGQRPDTAPRIILGPVASGSAVIAAQEMNDHVAAQHRKLVGIEMEAYGVYAAAAEAPQPRPRAVSIKAVCDFADDDKGDQWQSYAAYVSASALKHLAEIYL